MGLGLFLTLKPPHCSGGIKGEFCWGQEEAEQGGGPGGAGGPKGVSQEGRGQRCVPGPSGSRAPPGGRGATGAPSSAHSPPTPPHEIYKLFLHGKAQMPADSSPRRRGSEPNSRMAGSQMETAILGRAGGCSGAGPGARGGCCEAGQLGLETREAQAWP